MKTLKQFAAIVLFPLAFCSCDKENKTPDNSSESNKLIGRWNIHTSIVQGVVNGSISSSDTFGIRGAYFNFISDSTGRGSHYGVLTPFGSNEVDFTYTVTNGNKLSLSADTMHTELKILNLNDTSLSLLHIQAMQPDGSGNTMALHNTYFYSKQ